MASRCYCCRCDGTMMDRRKVVLRGIGRDVILEEVELFLESLRYCPIGGEVTNIERISEDSALVTFNDSQVAIRLIGKSLTMPENIALLVQSTQTIDHQPRLCVDNNETELRGKDTNNEGRRKSESMKSRRNECNVEDDGSESSEETESETRQGVEDNCELRTMKSSKEETRRSRGWEESRSHDERKTSTADKSSSVRDFKGTQDNETQTDQSFNQEKIHAKHSEVEVISFSLEMLKLIRLILGFMPEPLSNVTFDEDHQAVTVRGTKDDIETVKLQLYEIANNAIQDTIRIAEQDEELALSERVENWLNEEFSNLQFPAVCYNTGAKSSILVRDGETLKYVCELLEDILVAEKLNVDGSQRPYLQTLGWTEYVEDAEYSRIVSIATEESVVTVTGCASDVSDCVDEVREQLRANASTTRDMRCEPGVVGFLKSQANAINGEVSQVASSTVELDFDAEKNVIKLTGLENDTTETVKLIENFIGALCHGRYEAHNPGLTIEMFANKSRAGRDLIDLLELKYNCAIEVREQCGRHENDFESQHRRRRYTIEVIEGDIARFTMADALVNTVTKTENSVMRCFLRAGGKKLEQELKHIGKPNNFGSDVMVTSACEELKAKFIFHAAIGNNRNEESIDRLYCLIKKCLKMAAEREAKSIAFPTLGCGGLGFRPSQVVDCFVKAMKDSPSDLTVFIIAHEGDIARKFRSHIDRASPSRFSNHGSKGKLTGRERGKADGRKHVSASDAIVFYIIALSDDIIGEVKAALGQRITDMTSETPIHDKAIAKLSDDAVASIKKLQSSHVSIELDKARKTITVNGEKSATSEARLKIYSIIFKDWAKRKDRNNFRRLPEYWTRYKSLRHIRHASGSARVKLSSGSIWYREVSRLVTKTWENDKVGQGSDAAGLVPHRIKIRNIFRIENPRLYIRYMAKKQNHCSAVNQNPCTKINQLKNERRVETSNLNLRTLEATLSRSVNEYFLLHGTKEDIVDSIQAEGLDSRLSGGDAMFGAGTYFTESSTKADQYADSKQQRVPNGQSMYMYVCRVLLGNPFICQTPFRYRRPPCRKRGCLNDACTKHNSVGLYDSVIGTHRTGDIRLLFREFIVYHPDQSYPEFLVEYERKSV